MMFATLIGWVLVIGGIAVAVRRGMPGRSPSGGVEPPAVPLAGPPTDTAEERRLWCNAIEQLCDAEAFLFDDRLCLLAAGERALQPFTGGKRASHLIDIAPPESAPLFLAGAAAARRGEGSSWECLWRGRRAAVQTLAFPPERILIVLRVQERSP